MSHPLVTVNMLAHDRRAEVEASLRALRRLDWPEDRLEWIVVDNASADGTAEMVRAEFPDVTVIENENTGAAGWTRGFERGAGEWFLVLDDDCHLTGSALADAIAAAEDEGADLVSFRVESGERPGWLFNDHYPTGLLSYWGCAFLISRRAVSRLGGYDPNIFIWANELELTIRFLDAGFLHLYLPEVTAVHRRPPLPATQPARAYATHMRHLVYTAVKLLRGPDAAVAVANVLGKILLQPSRWRALPAVAGGARMALSARSPVRAEVSRLYRRRLRDFVSPAWRLRGRTHEDFYARHPDVYPTGRATLRI